MDTVISKVRNLIEDNENFVRKILEYNIAKVYILSDSNVITSTLKLYKNGTLWAGSNYSYDEDTEKVTVTGTLTGNDVLEVSYNCYEKYSDTEIAARIKAAISHLSVEQYKTFKIGEDDVVFPTPTEQEENLIAIVASILIKGDVVSYRTPEFSITFGRGESLDTKIKKIVRHFTKSFGILEYIQYDLTFVSDED
jgi:hypothetical protein